MDEPDLEDNELITTQPRRALGLFGRLHQQDTYGKVVGPIHFHQMDEPINYSSALYPDRVVPAAGEVSGTNIYAEISM